MFFLKYIFNNRKREYVIKNYDSYIAVLHYNMEKAYDMIHKDQIFTYSLEATTLPEKLLDKALKDFVHLVEKLLGPTLKKEMLFLYGNYDTFIFNLAEYFNTRYDSDEIRKTAMDNVVEQEVEPEGQIDDFRGLS